MPTGDAAEACGGDARNLYKRGLNESAPWRWREVEECWKSSILVSSRRKHREYWGENTDSGLYCKEGTRNNEDRDSFTVARERTREACARAPACIHAVAVTRRTREQKGC
ncbi:hypothetical protein E2542_SST04245 [Spatholobus suberectus]|nr:hypothetical protein E2542_SST04245 [Spatholobus suberectus]